MHADAQCVQNNILITEDGQACLGDFGIAGTFTGYLYLFHEPETLRYMAPERFLCDITSFLVIRSSKESDVWSLAMTSFSVCSCLKLSYS